MTTDLRASLKQSDGAPLIAIEGRIGKEVIYSTHNLTDPTTWYSESGRSENEVMVDLGNGLSFGSAHVNWIDMRSGKVFDEDALIEDQQIFNPGDPHGYSVEVLVNDVALTQRAPFASSGGDYSVDYDTGIVTFAASQAGEAVKASYSHAQTSGWLVTPLPGKALVIEDAEVQFSSDANMNKSFIFNVYGSADIFLTEQQRNYFGIPYGVGYPVIIDTTIYKTVDQIVDEAVAAYPEIPPIGGGRGFVQKRIVFRFKFGTVRTLYSSLGMYIRVHMEDDAAFTGERVTATYYCTSKVDPGVKDALRVLSD